MIVQSGFQRNFARVNLIKDPITLNNRLAILLSVVFHPLIVTTYLFGVLFFLAPDLVGVSGFELPALGSLLMLLWLNTFIAPAVMMFYFKKVGMITSFYVEVMRNVPLLIVLYLVFFSLPALGLRLDGYYTALIALGITVLDWRAAASWFALVAVVVLYDKFLVPRTKRGGFYRAQVLRQRTDATRL